MRVATSTSLMTALALAGASLAPPASATQRGTEAERQDASPFESLVKDIIGVSQCTIENRIAREYGGAIRRQDFDRVAEAEERARRPEDVMGKLRPPVRGTLVRRFGEKDLEGRPSQGITLRTTPGAQVVAPFDGTVTFAQPYGEYSQLLILSTAGGYHFVLAGMTKIYGVEGQKVLEGEPVAVMGDGPSAGVEPELYFEIRKDGKPLDPLPWLATAFRDPAGRQAD